MTNTAITKPRNRRMDIVRAIAIILIVLGHNYPFPEAAWFTTYFPMASYRLAIFLFASGYFFRTMEWKDYPSFLWKKTKGLALPFLGWNVVYAGIASVLVWHDVVDYLPSLREIWSFHNLFVMPFVTGHQYILNVAAWFVGMLYPALLLYGIIHIALRRFVSDHVLLVFYGLIAILGLFFQHLPSSNYYWFAPLHISYALFFIHFGKYYREYIEPSIERVSSWILIPVCLVCSYLIVRIGGVHAYSLALMNYGGSYITPLIMGIVGIILWMRLARIIEEYVVPNKLEKAIGESTWDIMTHHLMAKFIVGWLLIHWSFEPELTGAFRKDIWFKSTTIDFWMMIFLQVALPVLWHYLFAWIKQILDKFLWQKKGGESPQTNKHSRM